MMKKSQKALEEIMPIAENSAVPGDIETKESTAEGRALEKEVYTTEDIPTEPQDPPQERHKDEIIKKAGRGEKSRSASETARDQNESPCIIERTKPKESSNGAVDESSQWEKTMPSSILEKGIIYFFIRNRVGVSDAESVSDLQRTYFVLRPLPKGAKLGDGVIEDLQNNRLLALPKNMFPKSHRHRSMAFVEKVNTTVQDLKESVFQGSDYTNRHPP